VAVFLAVFVATENVVRTASSAVFLVVGTAVFVFLLVSIKSKNVSNCSSQKD